MFYELMRSMSDPIKSIPLISPKDPLNKLTYCVMSSVEEAHSNGMSPTRVVVNNQEFDLGFKELDILGYKVLFSPLVEKGKVILVDEGAVLKLF